MKNSRVERKTQNKQTINHNIRSVISLQSDCPCLTDSPLVPTEHEIRALENAAFEPISVRRIFDMNAFTVTYIGDIRGPADAVSEFNGTLRRGWYKW